MMDKPKTIEEARKVIYGEWAGNPKGCLYIEGQCAEEVWSQSGWIAHQCSRKNGYGPGGLYCKQHAKKIS